MALGYGIHSQEGILDEISRGTRGTEDYHFDEGMPLLKLVRLRFMQDKVPGG